MIKFRIEGTKEQIRQAVEKIKSIYTTVTVSKFYPNRAFGFERSEPQDTGRVYAECSE